MGQQFSAWQVFPFLKGGSIFVSCDSLIKSAGSISYSTHHHGDANIALGPIFEMHTPGQIRILKALNSTFLHIMKYLGGDVKFSKIERDFVSQCFEKRKELSSK